MLQIPIVGQSQKLESVRFNNERTLNWFPAAGPEGGSFPAALLTTPGTVSKGTAAAGGPCRGIAKINGNFYGVFANKFYRIDIDGDLDVTFTEKGTLDTQSEPLSLATGTRHIVICGGGSTTGYVYDADTDGFSTISDANFPGASAVVYVKGFFIFSAPSTQQIFASALNDPTSFDPLDFANASTSSDAVVGLLVHRDDLFVLGQDTIEIWQFDATLTAFPFAQRSSATIGIGVSAPRACKQVVDGLLILSQAGQVFLISGGFSSTGGGYKVDNLTNEELARDLNQYAVENSNLDPYALTYQDGNRIFYCVGLPRKNKSYALDLSTGLWHERQATVSGLQTVWPHNHALTTDDNQVFVGHYDNGKLYHLSRDYETDDGSLILRSRSSQVIIADNEQVHVSQMELMYDVTGQETTGQGKDPRIMLRYSKDGGRSWGPYVSRLLGKLGEYGTRVRWGPLGRSRQWAFELSCSEPVNITILSAFIKGHTTENQ